MLYFNHDEGRTARVEKLLGELFPPLKPVTTWWVWGSERSDRTQADAEAEADAGYEVADLSSSVLVTLHRHSDSSSLCVGQQRVDLIIAGEVIAVEP
jgi:hypothetical protein